MNKKLILSGLYLVLTLSFCFQSFARTNTKAIYVIAEAIPANVVKNLPSDFYKVVIDAPYNSLNTWIVK